VAGMGNIETMLRRMPESRKKSVEENRARKDERAYEAQLWKGC